MKKLILVLCIVCGLFLLQKPLFIASLNTPASYQVGCRSARFTLNGWLAGSGLSVSTADTGTLILSAVKFKLFPDIIASLTEKGLTSHSIEGTDVHLNLGQVNHWLTVPAQLLRNSITSRSNACKLTNLTITFTAHRKRFQLVLPVYTWQRLANGWAAAFSGILMYYGFEDRATGPMSDGIKCCSLNVSIISITGNTQGKVILEECSLSTFKKIIPSAIPPYLYAGGFSLSSDLQIANGACALTSAYTFHEIKARSKDTIVRYITESRERPLTCRFSATGLYENGFRDLASSIRTALDREIKKAKPDFPYPL